MTGERRATVTNTSKRRRAGKIPEWRVEDFQAIVSKNADAMIVLDREGYVLYVNPAAESLFNLPSAEMIGLSFGFPIILDEPVEMYILREFKDFVAAEVRLVEVMWAGEMSYLLSFRDLTDRIVAEQAMSQARDKLDAMVNERTRELSESNELLKREIAERERAEESLRKNEEMLRHIFDSSPVPMVLYNEIKNDYFFNKKFAETFGYSIEDVPGINEWWLLAYPDKKYREFVKKRWYAAVDDAIKNRTSISPQEVEVICKDGSKRHILGEFSSIGDINLIVLYDITERKQAEEAVKLANVYNRSLIEASLDPLVTISPKGVITDVNKATEAVTGYPRDDLIGTDFSDYFTEPENAKEGYMTVFKEGSVTDYPLEIRHRNGHITPVIYNASIYKDESGGVIGVFAAARDITGRKRAEEALQFERLQLLSIFDSIDEVIYVADPYTYEILYANKAMQDKFGKSLTGGTCYREIQDKDAPCEFCTNDIILRNKGEPYRWEFHNPTVNIDFGIVDRIIKWPDGRDVRFEIALDITERKRAEEALKDAKQQAELYVDLMGHDINNMNQVSLGFLELAHNIIEMNGKLGEDDIVLLDKAMDSLKNSSQLIDNVRKLQREKMCLYEPEVIDVGSIVEDAVKQFRSIPDRDIRITCDAPDHYLVRANALLKDVFANLVGNAVKHSRGALTINIGINRVMDNGKAYCRVDVEDNGPGIPDTLKDTLFDRLNLTTTRAKGKGFGLCLIKMLVDDFHGRFWVEDRIQGDYAKGARFVVMLPAADE